MVLLKFSSALGSWIALLVMARRGLGGWGGGGLERPWSYSGHLLVVAKQRKAARREGPSTPLSGG
jgi:hypothetical protein